MFRREYGETLKIAGPQNNTGVNKPKGDYNGNR